MINYEQKIIDIGLWGKDYRNLLCLLYHKWYDLIHVCQLSRWNYPSITNGLNCAIIPCKKKKLSELSDDVIWSYCDPGEIVEEISERRLLLYYTGEIFDYIEICITCMSRFIIRMV